MIKNTCDLCLLLSTTVVFAIIRLKRKLAESVLMIPIHFTLPITNPSIATVAIYTFVSMWNELNYAMVFLSDKSKMTLSIGLNSFKGEYSTNYVPMFAAVVIAVVPSILVFTVFNRQMMEGVTAGAVKG